VLESERQGDTISAKSIEHEQECGMQSLVHAIYLDSEPGELTELDPAGTGLENPYVYDSVARELKAMAEQGLVTIVREQTRRDAEDDLIDRIAFARIR
jgi:hypothetical protein